MFETFEYTIKMKIMSIVKYLVFILISSAMWTCGDKPYYFFSNNNLYLIYVANNE